MKFKKTLNSKKKPAVRVTVVVALTLFVLFIYTLNLISVQIVHGSEYSASMKTLNTYKVAVEASRGEICDRNGSYLVTNRTGYRVVFDLSYFPSASSSGQLKRNEIILALINLLESAGEEWIDVLPLYLNADGSVAFKDNRERDIANLLSAEELQHYATALNCFDSLIKRYRLSEYPKEEQLKIASVCYSMRRTNFSMTNPYTFARDVSIETAAKIKENSAFYTGVDISVVAYREYADGELAVHLLGNVGPIDADEYNIKKKEFEAAVGAPGISEDEKLLLRSNQYRLNDVIGKFGVEQAMEKYLRGQIGLKTVTLDAGENVYEEYTLAPRTGDNVILTIDRDLQAVSQSALERRIRELGAGYGLDPAGALVIIDVNTGDILAGVSYPAYNLKTFFDDYDDLAKSSASPLYNRAFQSIYAPGSTMKPAVALAALETGTINSGTRFACNREIDYKGTKFGCLGSHGWLNAEEAITESCNIFFYRTADILGITSMNRYCSLLGLGSRTGVETAEANGVLASVAYANSIGRAWNPGDTITSAIGQSYNLFTPLQLANYCATIANGGTRYVPHLIKSVKSYDYAETTLETVPEIAAKTGISAESLDVVKRGMRQVVTTGFCKDDFAGLPVSSAAKTGTSQKDIYKDGVKVATGHNGFVISFAPYEKPEIAIAVVIENVDSGTAVAKVCADIYDYYFSRTVEIETAPHINTIQR